MDFWEFLTSTYFGGLILFFTGVLSILWVIKYPQKDDEVYPFDLNRWFVGIGFILMGIAIIIGKLVGKL